VHQLAALQEALNPGDPSPEAQMDVPVQREAAAPPPNRTGMPNRLKSGLESLSGFDLSGVRVHYNSSKPAQLNAHAYTQGPNIHVAPGQERHVPHEGWHAVQQMQGRVRATTQLHSTPINDESHLEREADVMGARALQLRATSRVGSDLSSPSAATAVAQRVVLFGPNVDEALLKAVIALQDTPQMSLVRSSQKVTLIANTNDSETRAWMKTPWNRERFEEIAGQHVVNPADVDFMVLVNNGDLLGSQVRSGAVGASVLSSKLKPQGDEEISGSFQPKGIFSEPKINPDPSRASLDTILLHELGHILQFMVVPRGPMQSDENLLLAPPSSAFLTAPDVTLAFAIGTLSSPVWPVVQDELTAINTWVTRASGQFDAHPQPGAPPQAEADQLIRLIERAQLQVGLWLEHDVMTGVEHPFALRRNEPLRLQHGKETELEGESDQLVPIFDIRRSTRMSRPSGLTDLRDLMVETTQRLTADLPFTLLRIATLYQQYRTSAIDRIGETL